jgi:transposase
MSKYNRAFKLKLAKLAQHTSSTKLGHQFDISSRLIRYWSSVFQIHGLNSFSHANLPYDASFKIKVLSAMHVNNWSLGYCSAYFDLSSPGILSQWQALYSLEGISRLTPKKKGRPRMKHDSCDLKRPETMTDKELREELEYLRAENAVLKKLEALAQSKKKKAKKRP